MSAFRDAALAGIAREIMDEFFPHPGLQIGKRYQHPTDGVITITSGYFTDPHNGRLSNHWNWTKEDGTEGYGYGDKWPEVTDG